MNKARRRRRRRELKPLSVRPRESAAERVETPRPLPRWRIHALVAGLVLAGATLGAGIVLHVRGWPALGSESGGRCGGRFGAACPQGLGWVLLLAFGCTFAAFIALVGLSHAFMTRVDALRPGRAGWLFGLSSRRGTAIIAVAGLLAGLWPGVLLYDGLRGHLLDVRWSAPLDRPSGVTGVGNWVHDNLVVRARADRLTAYTDKATAWTMEIPGRDALCTMSREAGDGVGLVAWAADGQPCATVAALDLRTGRPLWQRTRSAATRSGAAMTSDELAITGDVAVFTEPAGLRAVGLRENDERWRLDVEAGCAPTGVAADADQVTMLVGCEEAGPRVVTVDPRTGRERWRAELPVVPPLTEVALLAADPVVVHAVEGGSRAEDVIISFSNEGQVRARIPRSGPDYDMPTTVQLRSWPARPVRPLIVWNNQLIAPISAPGDYKRTAVAGFSLETGARLWRTDVDGEVGAVEAMAEQLLVSTDELRLFELSADGSVTASVPVRGRWSYFRGFDLRKVKDAYAVIALAGGEDPPVMMVG